MNKYYLSKRLNMVADMVEPSKCHADIGCDHGFMALYLINNQIIEHAICTDINEGPLQRAKEHIEAEGYSEKIDVLLSDGLHKIEDSYPHITSATICGMGGLMGVKIMYDRLDLFKKMDYIYLQLQSDLELVRMYLDISGYEILTENIVNEEGKFYTAMKVRPNGQEAIGFDSLDELVISLRERIAALKIQDACKYYYPMYSDMNVNEYKNFLTFMINKYEKVLGYMQESSNGYDDVVRNLEIMKLSLELSGVK